MSLIIITVPQGKAFTLCRTLALTVCDALPVNGAALELHHNAVAWCDEATTRYFAAPLL